MRRFSLISLLLLAAMVMPAGAQGNGESEIHTLEHAGFTRSYTTYIPSTYEEGAALMIVLHPFASSGRAIEALSGMDDKAEEYGFIAAYPDTADFAWGDGRANYGTVDGVAVDDVGYIEALIDEMKAQYQISEVYLTGLANGGVMAYRMACDKPDLFAGVAVVGAGLWDYHLEVCAAPATKPVSLLMMVGDQDVYYPEEGREVESRTEELDVLSFDETIEFWRERNGCETSPVSADEKKHSQVYACADDTEVGFYEMHAVGNNWPRVGDYKLNQFGIDATEVITQYFIGGAKLTSLINAEAGEHILWGGRPRSYVVYVPPSYDPAKPTSLVIALHGRPDTGMGMAYLLDMNSVAEKNGFIVVYPDGVDQEWNYVKGFTGWEYSNQDDVKFLTYLAGDLSQDFNIDPARWYVTGFSNGGFMTQRMACDAADQFAAFGEVGGTLLPGGIDLCENSAPVPILLMHGTADQNVAWEGLQYENGTVISYPAYDTALFWAVHNGCDPQQTDYEVLPKKDAAAETEVYHYTVDGCAENSIVEFWVIDGGGHTLPGVDRLEEDYFGPTNMDIKAADVLWEFFEAHPKTDGSAK